MTGLDYQVNPLWHFLKETYGFEKAFAYFGPYAGASIQVHIKDRNTIESSMDLVLTNTNYVGSHFGGSLYSMCDPFYMFILMDNLGPEYIVWDKSAGIDFIKPGRGLVRARFHIPPSEIDRIRDEVAKKRRMDWEADCEILDEQGAVVARVHKVLYVRKMKR